MTEEEMREIRRRHVDEVFRPENFSEEDGFEQYKNAAHFAAMQIAVELVSKAYQEAAQVCVDMQTEDIVPPYRSAPYAEKMLEAAGRIRALASE